MLTVGQLMLAEGPTVDDISVYKSIGERIRQAREAAGLTQDELAARLGYTKYAVAKWEAGTRPISIETLVKLARELNKALSYFVKTDLEGLSLDPKFSDVMTNLDFTVLPVYGSVTAGDPAFVMDKPMDYITFPKQLLKGATFAVRVVGDSMNGIDIRDGDILLVRRQDTADPGDIVVARINGDEYTIKRLKVEGGKAILEPENPAYSPIVSEDLHVVGKVVSILRNL